MKTVEEFVKEINESKELQKAIGEIKDKASFEAFLKDHDCDATADDFAKFVRSNSEGEISDDAAGDVSGGVSGGTHFPLPHVPWFGTPGSFLDPSSENFDW